MPLTDPEAQRLQELEAALAKVAAELAAIGQHADRAIRESDRRAEEYLPILRRAGLAPPVRRRSRWL